MVATKATFGSLGGELGGGKWKKGQSPNLKGDIFFFVVHKYGGIPTMY